MLGLGTSICVSDNEGSDGIWDTYQGDVIIIDNEGLTVYGTPTKIAAT